MVEIRAQGVRVLTPPAARPLQAAAAELNVILLDPRRVAASNRRGLATPKRRPLSGETYANDSTPTA